MKERRYHLRGYDRPDACRSGTLPSKMKEQRLASAATCLLNVRSELEA